MPAVSPGSDSSGAQLVAASDALKPNVTAIGLNFKPHLRPGDVNFNVPDGPPEASTSRPLVPSKLTLPSIVADETGITETYPRRSWRRERGHEQFEVPALDSEHAQQQRGLAGRGVRVFLMISSNARLSYGFENSQRCALATYG